MEKLAVGSVFKQPLNFYTIYSMNVIHQRRLLWLVFARVLGLARRNPYGTAQTPGFLRSLLLAQTLEMKLEEVVSLYVIKYIYVMPM